MDVRGEARPCARRSRVLLSLCRPSSWCALLFAGLRAQEFGLKLHRLGVEKVRPAVRRPLSLTNETIQNAAPWFVKTLSLSATHSCGT